MPGGGGCPKIAEEWQSLMSALCSVVGSRRLKSSLRKADVIMTKGSLGLTLRIFAAFIRDEILRIYLILYIYRDYNKPL